MAHGSLSRVLVRTSLGITLMALLAVAGLANRTAVAQTPENTVRVVPALSPARIGETFSVFIVMDGPADAAVAGETSVLSDGIGAFEFTLLFDPAVVQVVGVEEGPALDESGRSFQCLPPLQERAGSFRYGCVSLGHEPGPLGSMTLAKVTLQAVASGSSPLSLDQASLSSPLGSSAPVIVRQALAQVKGRSTSATAPSVRPGDTTGTSNAPEGSAPDSGSTVGAAPGNEVAGATGQSVTPAGAAAQSAAEGGGAPGTSATDSSAQADSGSSGGGMFWAAIAIGGVATVIAVGLATTLWYRRRSANT